MACTAEVCCTCHVIIAKQDQATIIRYVHDPQVAVADVPEGSVVQLHVRDPHWARRNILKQIQVLFLEHPSRFSLFHHIQLLLLLLLT